LKSFRKKFPKPPPPQVPVTEQQRRLGRIVHDERGAGSVEWHDAPDDHDRPVLEVDESLAGRRNSKVRRGIEVLHIKDDDTFDPYTRQPQDSKKAPSAGKRDLRKLSEHIKLMRELEERKKKDDEKE
jgi:hypothetical protein